MGRDVKAGRDSSNSATYHDRLAATWDARYLKGSFARRAAFFASEILPELPRDGCWLDAGCGSGFFARMLASGGRTVIGVDASSEMVAAAKQNTESGKVQ